MSAQGRARVKSRGRFDISACDKSGEIAYMDIDKREWVRARKPILGEISPEITKENG